MPQVQLPVFPQGTTAITRELAVARGADQVVYYNGHLPVFTREAKDLASTLHKAIDDGRLKQFKKKTPRAAS
jgi:hypothetical protein